MGRKRRRSKKSRSGGGGTSRSRRSEYYSFWELALAGLGALLIIGFAVLLITSLIK